MPFQIVLQGVTRFAIGLLTATLGAMTFIYANQGFGLIAYQQPSGLLSGFRNLFPTTIAFHSYENSYAQYASLLNEDVSTQKERVTHVYISNGNSATTEIRATPASSAPRNTQDKQITAVPTLDTSDHGQKDGTESTDLSRDENPDTLSEDNERQKVNRAKSYERSLALWSPAPQLSRSWRIGLRMFMPIMVAQDFHAIMMWFILGRLLPPPILEVMQTNPASVLYIITLSGLVFSWFCGKLAMRFSPKISTGAFRAVSHLPMLLAYIFGELVPKCVSGVCKSIAWARDNYTVALFIKLALRQPRFRQLQVARLVYQRHVVVENMKHGFQERERTIADITRERDDARDTIRQMSLELTKRDRTISEKDETVRQRDNTIAQKGLDVDRMCKELSEALELTNDAIKRRDEAQADKDIVLELLTQITLGSSGDDADRVIGEYLNTVDSAGEEGGDQVPTERTSKKEPESNVEDTTASMAGTESNEARSDSSDHGRTSQADRPRSPSPMATPGPDSSSFSIAQIIDQAAAEARRRLAVKRSSAGPLEHDYGDGISGTVDVEEADLNDKSGPEEVDIYEEHGNGTDNGESQIADTESIRSVVTVIPARPAPMNSSSVGSTSDHLTSSTHDTEQSQVESERGDPEKSEKDDRNESRESVDEHGKGLARTAIDAIATASLQPRPGTTEEHNDVPNTSLNQHKDETSTNVSEPPELQTTHTVELQPGDDDSQTIMDGNLENESENARGNDKHAGIEGQNLSIRSNIAESETSSDQREKTIRVTGPQDIAADQPVTVSAEYAEATPILQEDILINDLFAGKSGVAGHVVVDVIRSHVGNDGNNFHKSLIEPICKEIKARAIENYDDKIEGERWIRDDLLRFINVRPSLVTMKKVLGIDSPLAHEIKKAVAYTIQSESQASEEVDRDSAKKARSSVVEALPELGEVDSTGLGEVDVPRESDTERLPHEEVQTPQDFRKSPLSANPVPEEQHRQRDGARPDDPLFIGQVEGATKSAAVGAEASTLNSDTNTLSTPTNQPTAADTAPPGPPMEEPLGELSQGENAEAKTPSSTKKKHAASPIIESKGKGAGLPRSMRSKNNRGQSRLQASRASAGTKVSAKKAVAQEQEAPATEAESTTSPMPSFGDPISHEPQGFFADANPFGQLPSLPPRSGGRTQQFGGVPAPHVERPDDQDDYQSSFGQTQVPTFSFSEGFLATNTTSANTSAKTNSTVTPSQAETGKEPTGK